MEIDLFQVYFHGDVYCSYTINLFLGCVCECRKNIQNLIFVSSYIHIHGLLLLREKTLNIKCSEIIDLSDINLGFLIMFQFLSIPFLSRFRFIYFNNLVFYIQNVLLLCVSEKSEFA